ncbi:MAG: response regulator [Bacteroidales bacterium]|nr:response regulator [Bacteroidales bacterium]
MVTKTIYKIFFSLLLYLCAINNLYGLPKIYIKHYGAEDGLPQNTVMDILQDKKGVMWFSTWDGLCKFDGYKFTGYKNWKRSTYPMRSNRIDHIKEDKNGNIWILSYDNEPHRFDPKTESFMGLRSLAGFEDSTFFCSNITLSPSGKVWLLSKNSGCIAVLDQDFKIEIYNSENGSLKDNSINFVFEDSKLNSWILTNIGISVFKEDLKSNFLLNENIQNRPFFTATEINNEIWLGTDQGTILIYNYDSQSFRDLAVDTNHSINEIKPIDATNLLITTNSPFFYIYNRDTERFSKYDITNGLEKREETIIKSFIDKSKRIWFELTGLGASLFDYNNKQIYHYPCRKESPISYDTAPMFIILEDKEGNIWVHPKGGGFSLFDAQTHQLIPFYNELNSPNWKFSGMLHSAFIDKQNHLWLCTHSQGLEKITFSKNVFHARQVDSYAGNPMNNNTRCIFESENNNLWISTKEGKVHIYEEDKYIGYLNTNGKIGYGIPIAGTTYCMMQDSAKNIWLGTKGDGLYKLTPKGKNSYFITQFKYDPSNLYSLSSNNIYSIFQDSKQKIWIGTYGGGINLMEEEGKFINHKNLLINYPKTYGLQVRVITEDPYGNICIGTTLGLIMFSNDYKLYNNIDFKFYIKQAGSKLSLTANDILDIITTKDKQTYFATFGGGINKIEAVDDDGFPTKFRAITRDNGLFSDIALQIVEDHKGNLWIASEGNLSVYDPKNNKMRTHSEIPKIIRGYSFTEGSKCLSKTGKIHFGYSNGILTINPFIIKTNDFKPYVALTNLQINNRKIDKYDEKSPLKMNIDYAENLVLNHKQNSINIEFSAIDYEDTKQIQYTYILEGFDNEWIVSPRQRVATYNNLTPGEYVFRVKSTNSDGVWVDNEHALPIKIIPSFWQTKWATLFYFIITILILLAILRSLFIYFRLKDKMALEKEEIEMRTRFFIDISHEIRTPLTMIVSPIENLLEREHSETEVQNQLQLIHKNAHRMLQMVNQILDFRKIEKSKLTIQRTKFGLFIENLCKTFYKTAELQMLNLSLNNEIGDEVLWIDRDQIEKLLTNLLSNAFKHTEKEKSVYVNIYSKGNTIALEVKDEGEGMSQEILNKLFTRFASFSLDKSQPSTGIGLSIVEEIVNKHKAKIDVSSTINQGSTFTIYFQKGLDHFKTEEIILIEEKEKKENISRIQDRDLIELKTPERKLEEDILNKNKQTLLIVEDDADLRNYIISNLKVKYNIIEAKDGEEAYKIATKQLPDFILSDIMMPKIDGVELLQKLKNNKITSHIPFILLTAKVDMESRLQGLKYGADDYITKPFSVKYLIARIENIIDQRKQLYHLYLSGELKEDEKVELIEEQLHPELEIITNKDKQFIKDVKTYIEANIDNNDFVVEDLANEMLMSRTVFFNKMKSLTGLAPIEFIREVKIKYAADIILSSDLTIKEIAFMVGFSDTKYFSRWFKNIKGMTPSEYRTKNKPSS